jgi:hypothetical protein
MRLTLRTLLAWLDDTLHPTQVREIGIQVAASPFTQELIDRIHRVSRQRRLSVPRSSGPEATDPNLVASYLDNDLDPEEVAEFEKKCLTSDVNLAEVASVHQILSLLGQKVKVPAEARTRMYQLVRGREAMRPKRPASARSVAPEPVTTPIQPWVVPELPRRSWIERFGPALACLLLIGLSSWSAWRSLMAPSEPFFAPFESGGVGKDKSIASNGPQGREDGAPALVADASPEAGAENSAAGREAVVQQPRTDGQESASQPLKAQEAAESKVAKASDSASKPPEPAPLGAVASGAAGLTSAPDGILLRYNPDQREWDRLTEPTPLALSNRILCLDPFQATLTMGKSQIVLFGGTEVRIMPQSTEAVPALELLQGRLLLRLPPAGALKVAHSERIVSLEAPADRESGVALERLVRLDYGRIITPTPPLVIYCTKGDISVSIDQKKESLSALDMLSIAAAGSKRTTEDALPPWATDAEPPAEELRNRQQFARMFHKGRPVLTEIAEASQDQNAAVRQLSIMALKSLGDMSLLMPILSRKDDPIARRTALAAIRGYLGLGPESASRMRDQLVEEFGEDTAAFVGKMLIGFSHEEASNPQVYEQLVGMLSPEQQSIGVRELALDTLKRLTGRRDDLGYDPDHAEGKGYSAWKELQRQGKLRLANPRAKSQ